MSREEKAKAIDSLQDIFSKCSIGILTDYRGLTAHEMTLLRRKLGESGVGYKVIKNTMARLALEGEGKGNVAGLFQGPVAIAFGYAGMTEPAKILVDYIRSSKSILQIKGGFFNDRMLTSEEVIMLSTLPSREELIAKLMGQIQGPIYSLLTCLNTPIRNFMGVLKARIQQLEGE